MHTVSMKQATLGRGQVFGRGAVSRSAPKRRALTCVARAGSRTDKLRQLLKGPEIIKGPCCHDALSARLIEEAGFDFAFMSGFCTAAARLGAPDTGLISYAEMVDQGRYIHEATRRIPIIGDGDTGYGNALNVKRTVRGYAAAGFAGILIEDQVWPKSCGHVRGKRVVPREEAVARIRAAADARDEGADILIVARTDARQAVSLEEAFARAEAFAEAGADVLFIDALASEDEMRAFCRLGGAAACVPKMANMLEGGGKTPILPPAELQAMGFALVAYPMSLLGVSIRAMQGALEGLKGGVVPPPSAMGTFADIQAAVGFPEYFEEEARYAVASSSSGGGGGSPTSGSNSKAPGPVTDLPPTVTGGGAAAAAAAAAAADAAAAPATVVVEPDAVIAGALVPSSSGQQEQQQDQGAGGAAGEWAQLRRSKFLRVRVEDARTGLSKLETRIPASFVGSLAAMVPQVAGVDLDEMLRSAVGGRLDLDAPLVDYQTPGGDVIKVWLEQ